MDGLSYDIISQIGEKAKLENPLDHPWTEIPAPPLDMPSFYLECCQSIPEGGPEERDKENYNVCCHKYYIEDLGCFIYAGQCRECFRIFWSREHDIYAGKKMGI